MSILSIVEMLTLHTRACRKCKVGPLCTIGEAYMRPIDSIWYAAADYIEFLKKNLKELVDAHRDCDCTACKSVVNEIAKP